jgi:hypothetical protein
MFTKSNINLLVTLTNEAGESETLKYSISYSRRGVFKENIEQQIYDSLKYIIPDLVSVKVH